MQRHLFVLAHWGRTSPCVDLSSLAQVGEPCADRLPRRNQTSSKSTGSYATNAAPDLEESRNRRRWWLCVWLVASPFERRQISRSRSDTPVRAQLPPHPATADQPHIGQPPASKATQPERNHSRPLPWLKDFPSSYDSAFDWPTRTLRAMSFWLIRPKGQILSARGYIPRRRYPEEHTALVAAEYIECASRASKASPGNQRR